MPFELEKQMYQALKGFRKIGFRLEGCIDPSCLVCTENQRVRSDAQKAIEAFEKMYGTDEEIKELHNG